MTKPIDRERGPALCGVPTMCLTELGAGRARGHRWGGRGVWRPATAVALRLAAARRRRYGHHPRPQARDSRP